MIRIIIIFLILASSIFGYDGPDFMLAGINYLPDQDAFNLCSAYQEDDGLKLSFQDASLYGIGSLRWTFAGMRYSHRCWTFGGDFRSYGINNLYESTRYSLVVHHLLAQRYSLGIGIARSEKRFGDNYYKTSINMLRFSAGLKFTSVSFDATINNISLKDKDDVNGDPELFVSSSWLADEALTVFGLYYRNPRQQDRFLFGQNLNLNRTVIISAGLMSGPEIYFVGLEVIYKGFVFGYTFYDLSGLPNCTKLTLSYR